MWRGHSPILDGAPRFGRWYCGLLRSEVLAGAAWVSFPGSPALHGAAWCTLGGHPALISAMVPEELTCEQLGTSALPLSGSWDLLLPLDGGK